MWYAFSRSKTRRNTPPKTKPPCVDILTQARSAAAEALLREKSPPGEMRMGLGWAVLHVDLVVYTEDSRKSLPKRVTGHLEWSNFWSTYQVGLVWDRLFSVYFLLVQCLDGSCIMDDDYFFISCPAG